MADTKLSQYLSPPTCINGHRLKGSPVILSSIQLKESRNTQDDHTTETKHTCMPDEPSD